MQQSLLAWFFAQVIDHLYRERISIGKQYGAGAQDGLKTVVEELSRLRYLPTVFIDFFFYSHFSSGIFM